MHIKIFEEPGWLGSNTESKDGDKALTDEKIPNSRLNQQNSDVQGELCHAEAF